MKKFLGISMLLMFLMIISVTSYSQTMETYTKELVLKLNWGKGPDEIGYLKDGPEGAEGLRYGPYDFQVTEDNTVLILDSVNKRVMKISREGSISSFDVPWFGESIVVSGDLIYINFSSQFTVIAYDINGNVKLVMSYNDGANIYTDRMFVNDGDVYFLDSIFKETEISIDTKGVRHVTGKRVRISKEKNPRCWGCFTGNKYFSEGNDLIVKDIKGNVKHVTAFDSLSSYDFIQFADEDMYGNYYLWKDIKSKNGRDRFLLKYSDTHKMIANIDLEPDRNFTEKANYYYITDNGTIYQMLPAKSEVSIIRYSIEK